MHHTNMNVQEQEQLAEQNRDNRGARKETETGTENKQSNVTTSPITPTICAMNHENRSHASVDRVVPFWLLVVLSLIVLFIVHVPIVPMVLRWYLVVSVHSLLLVS